MDEGARHVNGSAATGRNLRMIALLGMAATSGCYQRVSPIDPLDAIESEPVDASDVSVTPLERHHRIVATVESTFVIDRAGQVRGLGKITREMVSSVPVVIPEFGTPSSIEGFGRDVLCEPRENHELQCRGDDSYSSIYYPQADTLQAVDALRVREAFPNLTTCALRSSGHIECVGANTENGILGDGSTDETDEIVRVRGIEDAVDFDVSTYGGCAVRTSGRVSCWGTWGGRLLPSAEDVQGVEDVIELGVGGGTVMAAAACARTRGGRLMCWGDCGGVACGYMDTGLNAIELPQFEGAISLSVGYGHQCVVDRAGSVWCWGESGYGMVGNGSTGIIPDPVLVEGLPPIQEVSAYWGSSCALADDGRVFCWGAMAFFAWGPDGGAPDGGSLTPREIPGF